MSYPFERNLLDAHILSLRNLQQREFELRVKLYECRRIGVSSLDALRAVELAAKNTSALKYADSIEPRTFDVYMSEREARIHAFHKENPKPERQICPHENRAMRRERQGNGTEHVVTQCLTCGENVQRHPKKTFPDWQLLPEADTALREKYFFAVNEWHRKEQALHDELPPYIDRPEFDEANFKVQYLTDIPVPVDPSDCPHPKTALTHRIYKDKSSAAVNQCTSCGLHCSARSKDGLNLPSLPAFDEDKFPQMKKAYLAWQSTYVDALRVAMRKFNEERDRKIDLGEITVIDTTTYGTYYSTREWLNTRARIIERDDHRCQVEACGKPAECVHHITYDRLGRENDLDLISLCHGCHAKVHHSQNASPFGMRLTSCEIRDLRILFQ